MENAEGLLLELEEFNRSKLKEGEGVISPNLEAFIEYVAKTGKYIFPWFRIRKLFIEKAAHVINNLNGMISGSCSTMTMQTESIQSDIRSETGETSSESFNVCTSYDMNHQSTAQKYTLTQMKERILERMHTFTNAPFTLQRISELLLKPNSNYNRIEKYLRGLEKCVMVVTTIDPNGNKIFVETGPMYSGDTFPSFDSLCMTPVRPQTPFAQTTIDNCDEVASADASSANSSCSSAAMDGDDIDTAEVHADDMSNNNGVPTSIQMNLEASPTGSSTSSMEISTSSIADTSNELLKASEFDNYVDESITDETKTPHKMDDIGVEDTPITTSHPAPIFTAEAKSDIVNPSSDESSQITNKPHSYAEVVQLNQVETIKETTVINITETTELIISGYEVITREECAEAPQDSHTEIEEQSKISSLPISEESTIINEAPLQQDSEPIVTIESNTPTTNE